MTLLEKIQILMALSALFALTNVLRTREKWSSILSGLYILAITLSFVDSPVVQEDAYYLFTALAIVTVIYAFSIPDFSAEKRYIIAAIAIFSTLPNLFVLMHWPMMLPGLLSLIPFGLFVYLISKKLDDYRNDLGFLVILTVNSGISFFLTMMSFS